MKTVKDKKYLYFSYYENGEKREKSCGLASDKQSEKKALQFDIGTSKGTEKTFVSKDYRN